MDYVLIKIFIDSFIRLTFFPLAIEKAPKAPRPQTYNNYAPAVAEKRKPIFEASPAPLQYYDIEEEVPATQRPVQYTRPKYAVPAPQQRAQPAPHTQFSSVTDFDFTYGQDQRAVRPNTQYQQIDARQPVQFPPEQAAKPVPSLDNRSEQYSLFSPAAERADTFKSKVRPKSYFVRSRKRRKAKANRIFFIVKRRRQYLY